MYFNLILLNPSNITFVIPIHIYLFYTSLFLTSGGAEQSYRPNFGRCFKSLKTPGLNYLLTPWSRVVLGKLTCSHLVKKFPAFYGTRWFITAFISARHLSLS
jgi:hypothetical protein